MATTKTTDFFLALALVLMLSPLASAQSGCTTAIVGLAPCLSYITGNSSTPSSSCCTQLANVVESQPVCLCSVLNGGASSFGITINETRALAMPGACKVQTPPVSACNAVSSGPAAAPKASPATPTTPEAPSTPSIPANPEPETPSTPGSTTPATPSTPSSTPSVPSAVTGSKATPSTTGATSLGSSYKPSSSLMIPILYLVGCIMFANL